MNKILLAHLSDRLRLARSAARLSQAELAHRLGVTPSAVAQWEKVTGTRPGIARLRAIAVATCTNFHWLATGDGAPAAPIGEGATSVNLRTFARDEQEEALLDFFRRLRPSARGALCRLLEEIVRNGHA
ncbi:MAG TPA: helix-turn-helix domain-containing protein [Rudaea sp.]|nr:helix-turn-helix domain-containing protein [Rudaea sp.]